jgi:hypothetical protein
METQKHMAARRPWPCVPYVSQDGIRNFAQEWELLKTTALGASHGKDMIFPIKIVHFQPNNFTAAQSVEAEQKQNCSSADCDGCSSIR